jgi:hypothetical protein
MKRRNVKKELISCQQHTKPQTAAGTQQYNHVATHYFKDFNITTSELV